MVAITGLGAVTALGQNVQEMWEKILQGQHGITHIKAWDMVHYRYKMAGRVPQIDFRKYFSGKEIKRMDPAHLLAILAARMALADSGLLQTQLNKKRVGLFMGTSLSGMISGQKYHQRLVKQKPGGVTALLNYPMRVLLDRLCAEFGFLGPRSLISTACTASTIAIAHAVAALKLDQVDCVLVGGVDPLCEFSFAGFSSMHNMSQEVCAPFSHPVGLNLGEGAGMLVLEKMDSALKRNAKIYAALSGYALCTDAYHFTAADPSSAGQLILKAMQNSGDPSGHLDYINAHGTGTLSNDAIEVKGIHRALGDKAKTVPVSSVKGAIGHTLGAAGAIEAIITALAVYHNQAPPTANFKETRVGCCNVHHVKNQAEPTLINVALTQNFAFGGNNAALVLKKPLPNFVPPLARPAARVVITGMGVISPLGVGHHGFLSGLENGRHGFSLKPIDYTTMSQADFRRIDRLGALTLCAVEMAFKDAGLALSKEVSATTGIAIGTDCGPLESTAQFNLPIALGQAAQVNPILFPNTVLNAGAGLTAIHLKLKGPNIALNIGEASGLRAIAYAYDLIRLGDAKRMIAGGADECSATKLNAYAAILKATRRGALPQGSYPFDLRRTAMVLGEGAVFLTLESLDEALQRGVPILAEVIGHACSADQPILKGWDPSGEGVVRSMYNAMDQAGIEMHELDYLSAGALSDVDHDLVEARAIHQLFSKRMLPVSAFSAAVGVSAATGPTALAAALHGLKNDFIPFQVNYNKPDPACLLNIVHQYQANQRWSTALINAFSQGGANTSLVIKRYEE